MQAWAPVPIGSDIQRQGSSPKEKRDGHVSWTTIGRQRASKLRAYRAEGQHEQFPQLLYSAPDVKHDPANHNSARPTVKRGGHQSC